MMARRVVGRTDYACLRSEKLISMAVRILSRRGTARAIPLQILRLWKSALQYRNCQFFGILREHAAGPEILACRRGGRTLFE